MLVRMPVIRTERTVLCYEYCDCVNLRNLMELFGKKALGNGRGSGIKQDVSLLLWGGNPDVLL